MSNKNKAATLGMPFGTASSRLRKNVLFSLLKKHGENVCFRCKEIIETVADLSIEHKEPWEGRSAELFWDLGNIAFSHLRCNVPHVYRGSKPIPVPEGMTWCGGCKAPRNNSEFTPGAKNQCSICKAKINVERDRRKVFKAGVV